MEKSFNDEAQRQKNNAVNRALAATFQQRANELQSTYNSKQEEIERLKAAKSSLKTAITSYKEVKKSINSTLVDNMDNANFKGSIRTTFDGHATTIVSDITSDISTHKANVDTLTNEIQKRQASQNSLSGLISAFNKSASDCLALIR